jgi:hypothetical protein
MDLDEFWRHIQASKADDLDEHALRLHQRLVGLPPNEILHFDHIWDTLKAEAYHWDLWGAAYLINGGCSDDGFDYFRIWLLLQGREVFQAAVREPDSLADVVDPDDDYFEHECYPGMDAWMVATGSPGDHAGYAAFHEAIRSRYGPVRGMDEMGERWNFDDDDEVRERLPRLASKYLARQSP